MRPCEQAVSHALLTTSLCGPTRVSLHPDSVTMPPPALPLELLMMIALHITDDRGKLRHGDFNAFLQVNRALYDCLNRTLWKEAAKYQADTQRVITHSIGTNNLAALEFFLELGADVEVGLPALEITRGLVHRPTALLMAADLDNVPFGASPIRKRRQGPILLPAVPWQLQPHARCAVGRDGAVAPGPQFRPRFSR
jgi:hypothetical protein